MTVTNLLMIIAIIIFSIWCLGAFFMIVLYSSICIIKIYRSTKQTNRHHKCCDKYENMPAHTITTTDIKTYTVDRYVRKHKEGKDNDI